MITSVRFFEAGFCTHPEKVVRPDRSWRKAIFPAGVALLEHSRFGPLLFDTGYAEDFIHQTRHFPEKFYALLTPVTITPETTAKARLKAIGLNANDVGFVFASHFHADHVGGVRDFPRAKYVSSGEGYRQLMQMGRFRQVSAGFLRALLPSDFETRSRFIEADEYRPMTLDDEAWDALDYFGDGSLRLIPLPGHARGHYGLHFECGGETYFLVGDACWSKASFTQPILPMAITGLIMDRPKVYAQTIERLHALHTKQTQMKIIPCHCHQDER